MVKKEGSRVVFAEDRAAHDHTHHRTSDASHVPPERIDAGGGSNDEVCKATAADREAYKRTVADMQRTAAAMCRHLRVLLRMPRSMPHEDRLPPTRIGPQMIPVLAKSTVGSHPRQPSTSPKPARPRALRMHLTATNITHASSSTTSLEKAAGGAAAAAAAAATHVPAKPTTNVGHARQRHAPPKVPTLRFTTEALQRPSSSDDDGDDADGPDFDVGGDGGAHAAAVGGTGKQRSKFRREDGAKAPATPGRCSTVTPRWTRSTRLLASPSPEGAGPAGRLAVPPPLLMAHDGATSAAHALLSAPASPSTEDTAAHRAGLHPRRAAPSATVRTRGDFPVVDGKGCRLLWPVLPPGSCACGTRRGAASVRQQFRDDEDDADCAEFSCLPPGVSC